MVPLCYLKPGQTAFIRSIQVRRLFCSSTIRMRSLEEQISFLQGYSACDVSDALQKLQKPAPGKPARAGYLADIVPYAPASPFAIAEQPKVIAPVSTMKVVDKSTESLPEGDERAIPKGSYWVDHTVPGTVLIIDQPKHQTCAAVGGIMASRMKIRGLAGCVVSGRVRDLAELKSSGFPIWATGRSTVGSGAESKVLARNIPISVNDVDINPGDVAFCDPLEGIVVIPQDLVDPVIDIMPKLVEADDKVKVDVEAGATVAESFKKHRSVTHGPV